MKSPYTRLEKFIAKNKCIGCLGSGDVFHFGNPIACPQCRGSGFNIPNRHLDVMEFANLLGELGGNVTNHKAPGIVSAILPSLDLKTNYEVFVFYDKYTNDIIEIRIADKENNTK